MDDLTRQPTDDQLTPRELDILRLMGDGLSNQDVATRLFISLNTVKWYLKQIYSKLHVNSRTQAIAAARNLLATGHCTKVRKSDGWDRVKQAQTIFQEIPTQTKNGQIVTVSAVHLSRQVVGQDKFTESH